MELSTAWQESQTDRHSRPPVTVDALDIQLYNCWPSTNLFADPAPGDSEWDPCFTGEDDDRESKRNRLRCWYGSERPAERQCWLSGRVGCVVSFWNLVTAVNDGEGQDRLGCRRAFVGIDEIVYIWPVDVAKI
ncbi:hypothetical protein M0657_010653 [Pyricularia oryzae]|nr:hypothetical protein M9X92_010392 [Pyricularia oryzae]KAI7912020.1 hypothetical protein M0657_010653 [Pyricularia oryzae]